MDPFHSFQSQALPARRPPPLTIQAVEPLITHAAARKEQRRPEEGDNGLTDLRLAQALAKEVSRVQRRPEDIMPSTLPRNTSDNTEDDDISSVHEGGPWSSESEDDEQPSVSTPDWYPDREETLSPEALAGISSQRSPLINSPSLHSLSTVGDHENTLERVSSVQSNPGGNDANAQVRQQFKYAYIFWEHVYFAKICICVIINHALSEFILIAKLKKLHRCVPKFRISRPLPCLPTF